nr:M24 family metallopeptidase [Mycoplasmopsis cynos]
MKLPSVSSRSQTILKPGMIITVEPGIYIEGLGGARIEDDVLVTENGHYVFSRPEETNEKPF